MYSIGVDIGGTFTDFTVVDHCSGQIFVEKQLSTPSQPERAVLSGLASLRRTIPALYDKSDRIAHATTLVTNAILERKGARTALLVTKGFRDVLQTRLENRYNVYDLFLTFPEPIVERRFRYGVEERIYSDGAVATELSEADIDAIVTDLAENQIEAVAICYLHSYRNARHEARTAELIAAKLPGVSISVSHEVNPEPREYERSSTTALDAYVKPIVDTYLSGLEEGLSKQGFTRRLEVMLSNGGSTTAAIARKYPIQMIESGPAAGVEAAIWVCRQLGISDALSFDMGGTTAKLCLIQDMSAGRSRKFEAGRVHRFIAGSGMPVSVPVYDLVEIGAGGGSIARIDSLGLISVGPDSSGAEPGPACYGAGGTQPTVTDADVALGLIDAEYFLGGDMPLDADSASRALTEAIGSPLGISAVDAAHGIFEIVNELMASAARIHIAEKGADPSKLSLIAFGGAGPVHATALARKLGCPRVIFPKNAGVMSSLGLLTATPAFERMASIKMLVSELTLERLKEIVARLESDVTGILEAENKDIRFKYIAEMWFRGQEYPLEVPFSQNEMNAEIGRRLSSEFLKKYFVLYGRDNDDEAIEIANIRAIGELHGHEITSASQIRQQSSMPAQTHRQVFDPEVRAFKQYDVIDRASLRPGDERSGPLVVRERETGFVLHAADRLKVHEAGAIVVDVL